MLLALAVLLQEPALSASEQQIADRLKPRGGSMRYVLDDDGSRYVLSLDITQKDSATFDFSAIKGLTNLYALRIFKGRIRESSLKHLRGLPKLGLFVQLTKGLTDRGLIQICQCTKLKKLDIQSTSLTPRGLEHLAELKELRRLFLYNTTLRNKDLAPLQKLTWLDQLDLPASVTEKGAQALGRALPNTGVYVVQQT